MLKVHTNVAGTMSPQWQIGKSGPSILQGPADPLPSQGISGDLYVKTGTNAKLFVKRGAEWLLSGSPSFGFSRESVLSGGTLLVSQLTTYVGVEYNQTGGSTSVVLPIGIQGKKIIVKDEGGQATLFNITITPQFGDTIDGTNSSVIDNDYGSKTFLYENAWYEI